MLSTHQDGTAIPSVSLDAVTALIHSASAMMTAMESRLTERIKDNAEASRERWTAWEADFREYRAQIETRIQVLEGSVHDHHAEAERARIANEARVKPVLTTVGWIGKHWKELALVALFLTTAFVELVVGLSERLPQ